MSAFLFEQGANIVTSDQHSTDPSGGRFFMRMEFTLELDAEGWTALEQRFAATVAEPRAMDWRLARVTGPRRLALLASREDHCLLDLLWRASRGDLDAQVAVVVSNHETARRAVEAFGVPFRARAGDGGDEAGGRGCDRARRRRGAAATRSCSPATCRSSAPACSSASACR